MSIESHYSLIAKHLATITSILHRRSRYLLMMAASLLAGWSSAQVGPNCTHINASVGSDDTARVLVRELVTNADAIRAQGDSLTIEIKGSYGQRILYMEDVGADYEITMYACPYIGRQLTVNVSITGGGNGACWSYLTFKQYNAPEIVGASYNVYCLDPAVTLTPDDEDYPLPIPLAMIPCQNQDEEAEFVADWLAYVNNSCEAIGTEAEDTVKVILREFEAFSKDGHRGVGYDTIVVFRLPEITRANTYCAPRDTIYCEDDKVGPFMVVNDLRPTGAETAANDFCDTICFISDYIDPKCGISVHVEVADFADHGCMEQTRYTVEIKQSCYGALANGNCAVPDDMSNGLTAGPVPGYWTCEFWVIDLDTVPPEVTCDLDAKANPDLIHADTLYVPAGSHDCGAHTYLPPVVVEDECSGVKYVKAIVPGIATVVFEESSTPGVFEAHKNVKIPHGLPVPIYYEAYDSCHNIGYDTCWIKVKDYTKPVAVCDKGVIVGLSGKKVWVDATTFDEGSWDNCDVNLLLARRADWYEGCVDLCDSVRAACYDEHDTIWCAELEQDKHVDEVEAHYYKTMKWLKEDGRECSDLLWNAWKYDLLKHGTLACQDHPYPVDEHYFKRHLKDLGCEQEFENLTSLRNGSNGEHFITDEEIDLWSQIGGGWSDAVPFDCDDACKEVMVELLVVDYWCNWSKCWTWVKVEDKTPIQIEKDVANRLDITCGAYKHDKYDYPGVIHPVSIEWIVDAAKDGDKVALAELDSLFGGYDKVWRDEYGNVPEASMGGYYDKECICTTYVRQEKVHDEHLGYVWKEVYYDSCYYTEPFQNTMSGQVVVNCSQAIQCEQTVWCEFDHCGQGYIYRKWKFIPGCPPDENGQYQHPGHRVDTITRKQLIWVGNNCELDKGMFHKPFENTVYTCGIEYDEAGNATGDLSPEHTGYPEYRFDDDCRIIGINYTDKVFKIVGGDEACYKVVRTWYFIDWCYFEGQPENLAYWWLDPEYSGRTIPWEQKIIVVDTMPPVCTFENELGVVEAAGCYYNLSQKVTVTDPCGTLSYHWELHSVKGGETKELVAAGSGDLEGEEDYFEAEVEDLVAGDYKLKVRVTDECQNESYCIDEFTIETGKKPTAICITSLTAELTPMDLDQDGTIDTAMVTVWAEEFNSSSAAACDSEDSIYFRIELLDQVNDDTWVEDADSIVVGCEQIGTQTIRLWVIDEKGSFDFCDVVLVVQNNMGGCTTMGGNHGQLLGNIFTENGDMIESVTVRAVGQALSLNTETGQDGRFNFQVPMNTVVSVTPSKDLDHNNGISTMDLILMQKHIVEMSKLGSPYTMIAADVNADGFINALDLLEVRNLILGNIERFEHSDSWRFVLADYQFQTDQPQSERFPERLVLSLDQRTEQRDFIGMKVGDLDLDSDPTARAGRSASKLVMVTEDVMLERGEIVPVTLRLEEVQGLEGFQFTLVADPQVLSISHVEAKGDLRMSDHHFGLQRMDEGLITTSWNGDAPASMPGAQLFTVWVEATRPVMLRDALSVSSRITPAASYFADGGYKGVAMRFVESGGQLAQLYQNEPNPFTEMTTIRFELPEAMPARLSFYDIHGRLVHQRSNSYGQGLQSEQISTRELGVQGLIYYELQAGDRRIGRKMLVH